MQSPPPFFLFKKKKHRDLVTKCTVSWFLWLMWVVYKLNKKVHNGEVVSVLLCMLHLQTCPQWVVMIFGIGRMY